MSNEEAHSCGNRTVWHVFPVNDRREHVTDGGCCGCFAEAYVDGDGDVVVIHNSFDGRELDGSEFNHRLN